MVTYHPSHGPVVLCIMDGWGHRPEPEHNAVALAKTPVFDALIVVQLNCGDVINSGATALWRAG